MATTVTASFTLTVADLLTLATALGWTGSAGDTAGQGAFVKAKVIAWAQLQVQNYSVSQAEATAIAQTPTTISPT